MCSQDVPDGAPGIDNADDAFLGPLLPRQALANSRNVPAVMLLRRIGLESRFSAFCANSACTAARAGRAVRPGDGDRRAADHLDGWSALTRRSPTTAGRRDLSGWSGVPGAAADARARRDAARLVTQFLSDPMARLPSFPRYGDSEYPFAVALKTGTSQGVPRCLDAGVVAPLSGRGVGRARRCRADARGQRRARRRRAGAGGAAAPAWRQPHRPAGRRFAAPPGREPAELCTETGALAEGACAERLTEWVRPGEAVAEAAPPPAVPRLTIVTPEPDTHLWRNPEAPPALNRLVLRAAAEPKVAQIVWLVDGRPVAVAAPDAPVYWPLVPGRHRFQIRLPLQADVSRAVVVVVE